MNSGELYDLFRSDTVDVEEPYLWTDTEIYLYMNDAYRMFVRLTGGIADSSSALTQVTITADEEYSDVSPLILRFRQAYLVSTGSKIEIVNQEDAWKMFRDDYGILRPLNLNNTPGPVRYMIIGKERNSVQWVQKPIVDDTAQLSIYRLPRDTIVEGDRNFEFHEIGDEHHEHLMLWMKHRAYGKQDAETFDRAKREQFRADFVAYCDAAKAEWERYKHKTRVTSYGGL